MDESFVKISCQKCFWQQCLFVALCQLIFQNLNRIQFCSSVRAIVGLWQYLTFSPSASIIYFSKATKKPSEICFIGSQARLEQQRRGKYLEYISRILIHEKHIVFKSALSPTSLRHRFFNQSDCIIYALIQSEIVPQTTFPYRR